MHVLRFLLELCGILEESNITWRETIADAAQHSDTHARVLFPYKCVPPFEHRFGINCSINNATDGVWVAQPVLLILTAEALSILVLLFDPKMIENSPLESWNIVLRK